MKQKTDSMQGGSPNMTIKTTSKSPKTTGEGTVWRDTSYDSTSDNNQHLGFGVKERRNK